MHPLLNTATKAALNAGKIIARSFEQLPQQSVVRKEGHDFVTTIEHAAELSIVELLQKSYPQHSILSEELGGELNEEYTWIIDPLDGTTNYVHGFPQFCVSIALYHKNRIEHAVIYDPLLQELFTASRGKGAQLNNRRLRVNSKMTLEDALVSCPFELIHPKVQTAGAVRYSGAIALSLAYVAAGRIDGFWENELKIWDIAAGSLLIEEAGGLVSDWQGSPHYLMASEILAGGPKLFKELLPIVKR